MPGYRRKRTYRRRGASRLSRPAYYLAKQLDDQAKQERMMSAVTGLANSAAMGPDMVKARMDRRAQYLQATGRGAYTGVGGYIGRGGFLKSANKFLKGSTGRALSNMAAGALDPYTGGMASTALQASGYGAYYNGLFPNESTSVVPSFDGGLQDELGGICFSNKEYLGNIVSTQTFDNTMFRLNPGIASTFPFLAQLAQNYQEYAFIQLAFVFKTQLSSIFNRSYWIHYNGS